MPQLIKIMLTKPKLLNQFICLNFRCPYQAKVINAFDSISSPMVRSAFFIYSFFVVTNVIKRGELSAEKLSTGMLFVDQNLSTEEFVPAMSANGFMVGLVRFDNRQTV